METLRVAGVGRGFHVSAPSSPGRRSAEFFFSVPGSPIGSAMATSVGGQTVLQEEQGSISSSDFEFSARFSEIGGTWVSTADELFLNGQIRPITKLSVSTPCRVVEKPPAQCSTTPEVDGGKVDGFISKGEQRGRDRSWRESSRRRTRSLSPLRSSCHWEEESRKFEDNDEINNGAEAASAKSIRSSTRPRWSLKDFLYRSKSEGRGHTKEKLWGLSFSKHSAERVHVNNNNVPAKRAMPTSVSSSSSSSCKPGVSGRGRVPPSPHELHYTANRAQAEELKRKTFLPYRQGLLGCLGFSSKTCTVTIDGFAKPLNALGRH